MLACKQILLLPVLAAALTASGCKTTQPAVEIRTVEVAVPRACVPVDEIPPEPETVADQLTGRAADDTITLAESALRLRAWGRELAALLRACG